jgi:hypothetical protein
MVTIDNLGDGVFYFDFGQSGFMVWTVAKAAALAFALFGEGKLLFSELEKIE